MLRILIVDDREDPRTTLREWIEANLPKGAQIEIDDTFPLEDIRAYASYIREHDIAALLLDERLHEQGNPKTGVRVTYYGHDVVGHLRAALPDFPVYVVTTYSGDADLKSKEGEFEDVVDRDDFMKSPQMYTSRIQRAAMRFREAMQEHLNSLSELTLKAAQGNLTEQDHRKLVSTREVLGLPFSADSTLVVSDLIAGARDLAAKSEELIQRIKNGSGKK